MTRRLAGIRPWHMRLAIEHMSSDLAATSAAPRWQVRLDALETMSLAAALIVRNRGAAQDILGSLKRRKKS